MATGKITTLFSDKSQSEALFPRTKTSAISDDNDVGLDAIMEHLAYADTEVGEATTAPLNADTLGGRLPSEYATQDFVNNNIIDIKKNIGRYNLLDNSDFRNPVNQRGQEVYTNDGYCFDRWIIWQDGGCSVSYDSAKKCIRISSIGRTTLYQRIQKGILDPNKKYTQAYGLTDGRIIISTRIDYSPTNYDAVEGIMLVGGQTLEIAWTALYEGEYTAETLPEYHPKGYAHELAECQRYYYKIAPWVPFGSGFVDWDGKTVVLSIPIGVQMRVNPSVLENITVHLRGHFANGFSITGKTPTADVVSNTIRLIYSDIFTDTQYAYTPVSAQLDSAAFVFNADL
jgi:hypothetical protein